ncbi:MAG: alpha/beta fold hydrolase [Planctomycetota bacterium]
MKNLSIAALITFSSMSVLSGCAPESEHRAVSADNVAINYNVEGKGKPALVFVHGWCCDKSYWRHQVPHFSKRHKVVTIDLAGHGESGLGRKAWTIEAFGKDVAAVVKKLELDQVILIGHSMGGPVIIEAARQMPERVTGLVGVDTFLDLGKQYTQQQIDAFVAPFERDFAEAKLVRGIFLADADSALLEWVVADMCSARSEVGIRAMRQLAGFDAKEALKQVRKPIYCINSDMRVTNVEAGRRYAVSFEVKLMSGVGHFVMLEGPEVFNRLLTEIIDELSR